MNRMAILALLLMSLATEISAQPFDPDAATRAYLDRLSPEEKARSDAYFEGRYWLTLARFSTASPSRGSFSEPGSLENCEISPRGGLDGVRFAPQFTPRCTCS